MEDWSKLTVPQLKTACTERGLEVGGKKAELVLRIETHVEENKDSEDAPTKNGDATEEATEQTEEAADEEAADEVEEVADETEESKEQAEESTENVEGEKEDVDDVIDAIDDIIEEEKKEVEEKKEGEDTGEEKAEKDGEKKDDAKTEDKEKKETPKKTFVKVPIKRNVRQEVLKENSARTVVFGPLVMEDMKNDKMLEIFSNSEQWFVDFPQEGETGNAQVKFKSYEAAKELVESITAEPFKEDLLVKQLDKDVEENTKIDSILKGDTEKKPVEAFELRMLYLHNVPESATEDALKELVPEAKSAIIPRDDERKFKGYAYLEFEDIKKMEEVIKRSDNLTLESNKMTLHNIPFFVPEERRGTGNFRGNTRGNLRGRGAFDNQRGGYQRGGRGRGGASQYGDRWGNQGGPQQGGNQGNQTVDLLMGITQMLRTQQGGSGGGGGYEQRGYASQQKGYDNYGGRDGGYQQDSWGKKRRFDDGGYNQGGGYGGNKRFNTGRRY